MYFSEELKQAVQLGYKVTVLSGYQFSKIDVFKPFVEHFYNIKVSSSGVERAFAKIILNSAYGSFGRSVVLGNVLITTKAQLEVLECLGHCLAAHIIDDVYHVKVDLYPKYQQIFDALNLESQTLIKDLILQIQTLYSGSNMAIASAITAYSRMLMAEVINNHGVLYTDTDSVFTTQPLPSNLVSSTELGLFKDELNGGKIDRAIFLGPKQYYFTVTCSNLLYLRI